MPDVAGVRAQFINMPGHELVFEAVRLPLFIPSLLFVRLQS